ncbi:MAG: magnesium transporter, partial [Firmicutes bacterium]|nr:magnesium transporter [Bacillota bacterium]
MDIVTALESRKAELAELLEKGRYILLKAELSDENPADIADFIEELPAEKRLFVFRLLTKDLAAETFSYMESDLQEDIISAISDNEIRNIVDEMFLDDTVDFLSEIPANLVTKVLRNTTAQKRELINHFLNYPDNSAGSIMTIEFVQFHEELTVGRAMAQLRATGLNKETIYTCYVVNSKRVLVGIMPLRTLILAGDDEKISDLMETNIISARTLEDQEIVAGIFKNYDFISLPVVDNENRLVGIITVDDIVDVIEEEATEDIEKMAALLPSDDEYLKTGVFRLAKNRIIWLLILMLSGTVSATIMGKYEEVLSGMIILTTFVPILMNTGGSAGSQASTLVIRGMGQSEIELSDVFKVLWKEVRIGLIAGSALAGVNFLRLMLISGVEIRVNVVVSLSMFCVVILAKSMGCLLPMAAKKAKLDPAIMASPLI